MSIAAIVVVAEGEPSCYVNKQPRTSLARRHSRGANPLNGNSERKVWFSWRGSLGQRDHSGRSSNLIESCMDRRVVTKVDFESQHNIVYSFADGSAEFELAKGVPKSEMNCLHTTSILGERQIPHVCDKGMI